MAASGEKAAARMRAAENRFPLGLALAAVLVPGMGLLASGWGIQWGAQPPGPDALEMAWPYVNIALVWGWLVAWPAISLGRETLDRAGLAWGFLVMAAGAVPALGVAAFLSGVDGPMIARMLLLQLALGIFAMGVMSWRGWIHAAVLAGILCGVGVLLPIAGYLWSEFFAATSRAWLGGIPVIAAVREAGGRGGTENAWLAGGYAAVGMVLLIAASHRAAQ